MSKYSLEIQFANQEGAGGGRDDDLGKLVVEALEPCECRRLELHWHKGSENDIGSTVMPLHRETVVRWATWKADNHYEYPIAANGLPGDVDFSTDTWFIRPEVHLTGEFDSQTPLEWTPVPKPSNAPKPSVAPILPDPPEPSGTAKPSEPPKAPDTPKALVIQEPPAAKPETEPGDDPQTHKYSSVDVPDTRQVEQPNLFKRIFSGAVSKQELCRISIIFDREDRNYQPGELITGKVVVHVLADCTCDQLDLIWQWRTHGKGDQDKGRYDKIVLGEEIAWKEGFDYPFEFSFKAPASPMSYHGHYIYLDWYLRAKTNKLRGNYGKDRFTLWSNVAHETEFLLQTRDSGVKIYPISKSSEPNLSRLLVVLLPVMFGLTAGAVLYFTGSDNTGAYIWLGIVPVALGALVGFVGAPNFIAQLSLGKISLRAYSPPQKKELKTRIQITPKKKVTVESLSVVLSINEQASEGTGSTKNTHSYQVFRRGANQDVMQTLHPEKTESFMLRLELPRSLPASMHESNNEITWKLTVRIETDGRFSWKKSYPIKAGYLSS